MLTFQTDNCFSAIVFAFLISDLCVNIKRFFHYQTLSEDEEQKYFAQRKMSERIYICRSLSYSVLYEWDNLHSSPERLHILLLKINHQTFTVS